MASFVNDVIMHLKEVDRPDVQEEAVNVLARLFGEDTTKTMAEGKVEECFAALGAKSLLEAQAGPRAAALMTNVLADYPYLIEKNNALVIKTIAKRTATLGSAGGLQVNLYLALLNNLTTSEKNCEAVADSLVERGTLSALVNAFLEYNPQLEEATYAEDYEWSSDDAWQYMAHTLCNLCRVENVRTFLFQRFERNYIAPLLLQIKSKNSIRRRGTVATLRTLMFKDEHHWRLVVEENALLYLLSPLAVGHEGYDDVLPLSDYDKNGMDIMLWCLTQAPEKRHEPDEEIMALLLDCLRLLCVKRVIRYELRKRRVYPVLRNLDLACADDEKLHARIFQPIRDIVDLIEGDEDPEELRAEADRLKALEALSPSA
jgi:hypothetical protein